MRDENSDWDNRGQSLLSGKRLWYLHAEGEQRNWYRMSGSFLITGRCNVALGWGQNLPQKTGFKSQLLAAVWLWENHLYLIHQIRDHHICHGDHFISCITKIRYWYLCLATLENACTASFWAPSLFFDLAISTAGGHVYFIPTARYRSRCFKWGGGIQGKEKPDPSQCWWAWKHECALYWVLRGSPD